MNQVTLLWNFTKHFIEFIFVEMQKLVGSTARSREDETRNGNRNAKQNPGWNSQVFFQMAYLKKDLNIDHHGFRFAFQRAFRVSSSRERAVLMHNDFIKNHIAHIWKGHESWIMSHYSFARYSLIWFIMNHTHVNGPLHYEWVVSHTHMRHEPWIMSHHYYELVIWHTS